MNVKDPHHGAGVEADDLDVEVDLDEVPDAAQQGTAIVGGGVDAAKAYVAPIAVPARVESKPPPPAESKVRIDSRVDPRRMPTVKITARQIAEGAIPGWRPGGPAASTKAAQAEPRPDWMVSPDSAGAPLTPAPPATPANSASGVGTVSGVLWAFAIVLTACAVAAVGAVLWVELSRRSAPPAASSAETPVPSATSSALPELAPVVPAATSAPAPAKSGSKRGSPKTRPTAR